MQIGKAFRGKSWNLLKNNVRVNTDSVPDTKIEFCNKPDNIARIRLGYRLPVAAEKIVRVGQTYLLFRPCVIHQHVTIKYPGTNPCKNHSIPVQWVHVRLYLENKS